MHGGKVAALNQISEFIIIGGAGFSSLLAATSFKTITGIIKDVISLLKPDPYGRAAYTELLQMLHELASTARRDGLLALESHVERPETSDLFARFPSFAKNHHAVSFLCDSVRLVIMGGVGLFELQEMMDGDIETHSEEVKKNPSAVARIADAMPAFGIVAAVLGVVITMQAINGPPEQIGEKVGAALVGTFLGVLLSYGVFAPLAVAMEGRAESGIRYLACLKAGILTFAQGMSPLLVVEFGRRSIEPEVRPSFQEIEGVIRGRTMSVSDQEAA
jgi:chemotaxis protein MotA